MVACVTSDGLLRTWRAWVARALDTSWGVEATPLGVLMAPTGTRGRRPVSPLILAKTLAVWCWKKDVLSASTSSRMRAALSLLAEARQAEVAWR